MAAIVPFVSGCAADATSTDDEVTESSDEDLQAPAEHHALGHSQPPLIREQGDSETAEEAAVHASSKTHDWAAAGYVTPVKNQGDCGSCFAFATVEAIESSTLVQWHTPFSKHHISYSVQDVVSCDRNGDDRGCHGGWAPTVLRWIGWKGGHGLVDSSQDPYEARNTSCPHHLHPDVYVKRWGRVPRNVQAMKNAIQAHGPIIASIFASRAFENYRGGVFRGWHHQSDANHDIVITGWDDGRHAWRVRNSWGSDWGEGGYAWLEYGAAGIGKYDYVLWVQSIDYH